MRISDWSSDVCSSDLHAEARCALVERGQTHLEQDRGDIGERLLRALQHLEFETLCIDLERQGAPPIGFDHLVQRSDDDLLGSCVPGLAQRLDRPRSAEPRGGKTCVSTFRYRWLPYE